QGAGTAEIVIPSPPGEGDAHQPGKLPGFLLPKNRPTSQNPKIKNQRRCLGILINYMLIFSFLNVTRS
ncbi:hypothetical protein, partial [Serratia proteamaculans]|uniref:hypothetical protein n=1 Tax=Serratia proteamaculans TaxID=28151 RepID=UPI001C433EB6